MRKLGQQLQEKHVQHWIGAAFITCSTGMVQPLSRAALGWCSLSHVSAALGWCSLSHVSAALGLLQPSARAALGFCSTDMVQPSALTALGWCSLQHLQRWGRAAISTYSVGVVQPSALTALGWCSTYSVGVVQHLQRWGGAAFSTYSVGVVQPSALAAFGWCSLQHCSPSASMQRHGRNVAAAALSGKEGGVRWGRWGGVTHVVHGCLCVKVKCCQEDTALRKKPVCQVKLPEGHAAQKQSVVQL